MRKSVLSGRKGKKKKKKRKEKKEILVLETHRENIMRWQECEETG